MAVTWYLETATRHGEFWYEREMFLSGAALRRAWNSIQSAEYADRIRNTLMYQRFYEGKVWEEEKEKTTFDSRTWS